jgi:hypothetical protein
MAYFQSVPQPKSFINFLFRVEAAFLKLRELFALSGPAAVSDLSEVPTLHSHFCLASLHIPAPCFRTLCTFR